MNTPPDRHVPSWELPAVQQQQEASPPPTKQPEETYLPLHTTLRLYAGWLLAWYGLVYLAGSFRSAGLAPWVPEFVQTLFASPLTLYFACATYLFLLLGTVHRLLGGGVLKGIACTAAGGGLLWGFWTFA